MGEKIKRPKTRSNSERYAGERREGTLGWMVFMMGKQIRETARRRWEKREISDQRTGYVVVPAILDKDKVSRLDTIVQLTYRPR